VVDDGLGLHQSLELLVETLVHLREVQLARAVWHVLQVDEVAVRHGVGTLKDLVLLEVHLERGLVGEVDQAFFELDEFLHGGKTRLNPEQRLVDGSLNGQQLAGGDLSGRHPRVVRRVWVRLVVKMEVLVHAGLAQRHLVGHAERVNHRVVLVAKQHAALLGAAVRLSVHHLWLPRV
jgi:hypothetical protein